MSYEYTGVGMTREQSEEFGGWLNLWADFGKHADENRDYRAGYVQAVQDILRRFTDVTGHGYKRVRKRRGAKP